MRIKISRKEAKETVYWLRLLKSTNVEFKKVDELIQESTELKKILSAILNK
jgi:four helix bundle protein